MTPIRPIIYSMSMRKTWKQAVERETGLAPLNLDLWYIDPDIRMRVFFNKNKDRYDPNYLPKNLLKEGYCKTGRSLTSIEADFFQAEFGTTDVRRLPFDVGSTIVWKGSWVDSGFPCLVSKTSTCYIARIEKDKKQNEQSFYRIEFDPG